MDRENFKSINLQKFTHISTVFFKTDEVSAACILSWGRKIVQRNCLILPLPTDDVFEVEIEIK